MTGQIAHDYGLRLRVPLFFRAETTAREGSSSHRCVPCAPLAPLCAHPLPRQEPLPEGVIGMRRDGAFDMADAPDAEPIDLDALPMDLE